MTLVGEATPVLSSSELNSSSLLSSGPDGDPPIALRGGTVALKEMERYYSEMMEVRKILEFWH